MRSLWSPTIHIPTAWTGVGQVNIAVMRLTWNQDLLGFCHRVGWSNPFSWVYSVTLSKVWVSTLT
jgi:hypothetical protein